MNKLLSVLGWIIAAFAITANLWLIQNYVGYSREMIAKIDTKAQAVQVIENNYYSLLNFTRNEFKAIKHEAGNRRMPFLQRLFRGSGGDLMQEPDMSQWLDPYAEREPAFPTR